MPYSEIKKRLGAIRFMKYRKVRKRLPVYFKDVLMNGQTRRCYIANHEITEATLDNLMNTLTDKETKAVWDLINNGC